MKNDDGTFKIEGLTSSDLEIIQEGILMIFAQSRKPEHKKFREQVLMINRPIDGALDKIFINKEFEPELPLQAKPG